MVDLVLVVEGHGDVEAMPNLVGKVGAWLGLPLFTRRPIRSQGWGAIKKDGGLEKFVGLAASHECQRVVVVVDLDDDCPVEERQAIEDRRRALEERHSLSVEICFCIREFEAWFLASLPELAEGDVLKEGVDPLFGNHDQVRDAKGHLRSVLKDGYSESSDQGELVRHVEPVALYARDRSFRRFVKCIASCNYGDIEPHLGQ